MLVCSLLGNVVVDTVPKETCFPGGDVILSLRSRSGVSFMADRLRCSLAELDEAPVATPSSRLKSGYETLYLLIASAFPLSV